MDKTLYTLIVHSENFAGLLNQVTAVFTRRQINIESLNVSASSIKGVHKYTITALFDQKNIKNNSTVNALLKEKTKIDKQLENIANAIQNGIVSKTTAKRLQDLEEQQEKLEREILIEQSKQATPLTRVQIKEFYSDALEMEPRMLIEYLVKEVIMYDDKIQIIFKSPINTVPDEDRGFLLSANFCEPKKVISSRWSTKRKILVEIRAE